MRKTVYVASFSGGKDSCCMVDRLIEEHYVLDAVIAFRSGMDFDSVEENILKMKAKCEKNGILFGVIDPRLPMEYVMCEKPVEKRDGTMQYGMKWCGYGGCRWQTAEKLHQIEAWYREQFPPDKYNIVEYVGLAKDEPERIQRSRTKRQANAKIYPLVEWGMTEAECLKYCFDHGWHWYEDGIELYSVIDRLSCVCCGYKNLKDLRAMYRLPKYWSRLKALQARMPDFPLYAGKYSTEDLEKRFRQEDAQMTLTDWQNSTKN